MSRGDCDAGAGARPGAGAGVGEGIPGVDVQDLVYGAGGESFPICLIG